MNDFSSKRVYYRANDSPSFGKTVLFGFQVGNQLKVSWNRQHRKFSVLKSLQQLMVCSSAILIAPFVVSTLICAGSATIQIRIRLISTTLMVTGLATILQNIFGVRFNVIVVIDDAFFRLALLQGPSFAFLPSLLALKNSSQFECIDNNGAGMLNENDYTYLERMRIIQSGQMTASFVQMIIGMTGCVGLLSKYIGPLTIAPLMLLLELSIVEISLIHVQTHWMSIVMLVMLLLVAFYLSHIRLPFPTLQNGHLYLITIGVCWLFCLFLTLTNLEPEGGVARTDRNETLFLLYHAPWFEVPYPGQWGPGLDVNLGIVLGFVATTVASVIESVGDYHACARVSDERPPPAHSINRGILVEGMGCFIGGVLGNGVGVTTYSESIGAIGITKVASRHVLVATGVGLVILGLVGKLSALLAALPEPLIGGILVVSMSVVGGVGLSSVQSLSFVPARNVAILGLALMFGMLVPLHFEQHPFNSDYPNVNQVVNILFTIRMLVGGIIGFILDNTMPGATRAERGFLRRETDDSSVNTSQDAYSLPNWMMTFISYIPFATYLPFFPTSLNNSSPSVDRTNLNIISTV